MTMNNQTLFVFTGLPGVGKSTAINILTELYDDIVVHSSDHIRKELFDTVTYSGAESKKTYTELYDRTRESLANGTDTVIDGTMSLKHGRNTAADIATDTNSQVIFIKVECPPEIAKTRIQSRSESTDSVSDADVSVYESFEFEQLEREHITLHNNSDKLHLKTQIVEKVLSHLSSHNDKKSVSGVSG